MSKRFWSGVWALWPIFLASAYTAMTQFTEQTEKILDSIGQSDQLFWFQAFRFELVSLLVLSNLLVPKVRKSTLNWVLSLRTLWKSTPWQLNGHRIHSEEFVAVLSVLVLLASACVYTLRKGKAVTANYGLNYLVEQGCAGERKLVAERARALLENSNYSKFHVSIYQSVPRYEKLAEIGNERLSRFSKIDKVNDPLKYISQAVELKKLYGYMPDSFASTEDAIPAGFDQTKLHATHLENWLGYLKARTCRT